MLRTHYLAAVLVLTVVLVACSGSTGSPIMPDIHDPGLTSVNHQAAKGATSKAIWGLWQVNLDTSTMDLSVVPLRGAQYTVDVVTFLQPPAGNPANLSLVLTDITEFVSQGLLDCDVTLRHPFPGLDEYTGFDVYGVFIGTGSESGIYDSDVIYSDGVDDPILLNADGYTRWMNPTEFPDTGTILDFTPGKLGNQDIGLFNATINGYKYFADGLAKDESVAGFFSVEDQAERRGLFAPGSVNTREYQLKFPMVDNNPLLQFQYAVVASWIEPDRTLSGDPDALDVPGDFPTSANADEAFFVNITDNSNLYYDDGTGGGSISLELEVFDWGVFATSAGVTEEIHDIVVDYGSSGTATFDYAYLAGTAAPGSSIVSSVYNVEITGFVPTSNDPVPVLITVESEAPDTFDVGSGIPNNDDRLASYFRVDIPVPDETPLEFAVTSPNGGETVWMALYHEITWNPNYPGVTDVMIEYSTDDFVSDINTIIDSTENDGSYTWLPVPNVDSSTVKIRITDVGAAVSDMSDDYFTIARPIWIDFADPVSVTTSTVSFSVVDYLQNYDEFSPALVQGPDAESHIVWHSMISGAARETVIRSTDGDNWTGQGGCFFTSGGTTDIRRDCLKLCATPNAPYVIAQHWSIYFSVDVDHFVHGHNQYNYPNNMLNDGPHIDQNAEIIADDTYLYEVADRGSSGNGPGIYSIRVTDPDPSAGWVWPMFEPLISITDNGEMSHSRSWCFQDGQLVLSYFTVGNQIKLARQTDQTANTWTDTEVIFDGATWGYTNSRHPSICEDADGRLFAIWVAQDTTSSEWHLLAAMEDSGTGSWSDPVIVTTNATEILDAHVTVGHEAAALPTGDNEYPVLVSYEVDGVTASQISPMDLWAFLPIEQVSPDGDITRDPDVLAHQTPYLYDALFVWAYEITPGDLGVGDYDIMFVNGDFETP